MLDFDAIKQRVAEVGFPFEELQFEHVQTCNLCGSSRQTVITHRDRYGLPLNAAMCMDCGLIFLNPRLSYAEYGRFYADYYRPLVSAFHNRLIDAHTVQAEQLPYAETLARFLRRHVPAGSIERLLDVGGSTGVVAQVLTREFGCAGMVIDPAPAELTLAKDRGLAVEQGLVEDLALGKFGIFEMVILCQTVDHLLDIAGSLRAIRSSLKKDGWFYIDILDAEMNLRRNGVRGSIKIDHPYYLTPSTMTAYLEHCGFVVRQTLIHPDGIHVGYLCQPGPELPLPDMRGVAASTFSLIRSVQIDPRLA